jgi:hypothetical protein
LANHNSTFFIRADSYAIFCFLVDEKINLKVFPLKLIVNLEILSVIRFKDPKAGIFILKMLTESRW